ncbi:hypothetical protein U0070_011942 [Myodes glareolus]|uniref:Uncharacterized protein n=1 Tax=Myodes glareolus TaxID=447135 RepID=A0AAW0HMV3_MYOGA
MYPETSARCLTKSSSASSPASLLLCAHPQSAQSLVLLRSALSLVLPQSAQSLALLQSALSLVLLQSAQSHASRNVLLCNLLHPASRSAHPRASECFSRHQDQEKRRKSVSHTSTEIFPSHFKACHGYRRILSTLLSPCGILSIYPKYVVGDGSDEDPEASARCLAKSSSASSPASLLLCAHPQSALSLVLPQSTQSLVLPQSAQSLVLPQSAQSLVLLHSAQSHASRNALLCNLLHPASRSAHPRATECFSHHQDQEKRRKSVSHISKVTLPSSLQVCHGYRRIFYTFCSPRVCDVPS